MIFRQRHVGHSILDFPGSYSNWIKGTKGKNSVLKVKNATYEKKKENAESCQSRYGRRGNVKLRNQRFFKAKCSPQNSDKFIKIGGCCWPCLRMTEVIRVLYMSRVRSPLPTSPSRSRLGLRSVSP